MTPQRFRTLVTGVLRAWDHSASPSFHDAPLTCHITRHGEPVATVGHIPTPLGDAWRIECPGRTPRLHRSVVPALATLREAVCPDRPAGRALFAAPPTVDGPEPAAR